MGVEGRQGPADDDGTGSDFSGVVDAQPEPVSVGGVKLTLPGRRAERREPPAPEPAPDQPVDADDRSSDEAQESPVDATSHTDDLGPEEPALADELTNYANFGDKAARRHVDYRVVQVLAGAVAVVLVAAGLVWWFGHSRGADEAAGYEVQIPAGGSSAPPAAAPPVVDDVLPLNLDSRCDNQTEPRLAGVGNDNAAWVCPTLGVPFGQKIVGTLPKPYVITGIKFWAGFHGRGVDGGDEWNRHRVIDLAQAVFNDAERSRIELAPHGERREYSVPINHLVASAVEFTVLASSPAPVTTEEPGEDQAPEPLFRGPRDSGDDRENDPSASSVALSGFALIGHPVP